jgi:hypothetical protein
MAKPVKSATAVPDPKENVNPTAASVGAKRAHQDAFGTTAAKVKKKNNNNGCLCFIFLV